MVIQRTPYNWLQHWSRPAASMVLVGLVWGGLSMAPIGGNVAIAATASSATSLPTTTVSSPWDGAIVAMKPGAPEYRKGGGGR